jgi:hypothetical protein
MREEPMVAHADAEASGDPPQEHGDKEGLPMEHEERGNGAEMERNHDEKRQPNYRLSKGSIVSEKLRPLHDLDWTIKCPRSDGEFGNTCVMLVSNIDHFLA